MYAAARQVSIADWVRSPLEAAAFLPRLLAGSALSAREQLPLLTDKANSIVNIISNSPGPWDTKLVCISLASEAFSEGSVQCDHDRDFAVVQVMCSTVPSKAISASLPPQSVHYQPIVSLLADQQAT